MSGTTTQITVRDICGAHCVGPEEAENVFDLVVRALRAGERVRLDFAGVETLASSFLNVALGRLYGDLPNDVVDTLLEYQGIDAADDRIIRVVIRNAKDHYAQTAKQRDLEQQIVKDLPR